MTMKQKNNILSKQADILLLQHNNPYAIALERQIFLEAIEQRKIFCKSEYFFTGIIKFLSRRKIQNIIGRFTAPWILNHTVLSNYLDKCNEKFPVILFLNSFFTEIRYPVDALNYLKKKYGAVFVLYYIDPIERGVCTYANYLRENNVFDMVYTFDKANSEKYNLKFWQTPYSSMKFKIENQYDLYFCGVDTDREQIIDRILQKKDINCRMDVVQVSGNQHYCDNRVEIYTVSDIRPYREVLERTLKANCILEIVRPGQVGFTLRTFEAVVYNKKLLTNNKNVKKFKFYNPEYMKVFEKIEDIDWKWLHEIINVNYHYDGSFSPLRFIKEIEDRAWQMKNNH